jgi:hypothetical protein
VWIHVLAPLLAGCLPAKDEEEITHQEIVILLKFLPGCCHPGVQLLLFCISFHGTGKQGVKHIRSAGSSSASREALNLKSEARRKHSEPVLFYQLTELQLRKDIPFGGTRLWVRMNSR